MKKLTKKMWILIICVVVIVLGVTSYLVRLQVARNNEYLTKRDIIKLLEQYEKAPTANEFQNLLDKLNQSQLTTREKDKILGELTLAKPIIYIYPQQETEVSVKLEIDGELTCTYPPYNNGWNITAKPDGALINHADNKEYSYLFWEGKTKNQFDMSKGFVVKGTDTAEFLQEKLSYMGLTPREYNEFIVFWLPILQENEYNLISFQGKAYTDTAKLEINPKPDSLLRVYMRYKPLDKKIHSEEQKLKSFQRKGFTVVEWGGGETNEKAD